MNSSLDFLDKKTVLRYLVIFAVILVAGAIGKDSVALLITAVFIVNVFLNRFFESIELWLIWFFSFGFFTGQGYISSDIISRYIAKPSFLLLVIFIYFYSRIPFKFKTAKFNFLWTVFLFLSLLSLWFHDKSLFVLITISSFFLIYLLVRAKGITKANCGKLLNLFIAVAILQTLVSILQVAQVISAPTKIMDDGSGGQFEWVAGLDDVSSGTFGPVTAHIVSWYASLIALFCLLVWARCRKRKYLVVVVIALFQFATVDSKTIMAVMIIMMLYLLYYLNKNKLKFRLNSKKMVSIIVYGALIGVGLFQCLNLYYQYQNKAGGVSTRGSLSDVYTGEVQTSQNVVLDNIGDWGKIQGFRYVYNDFIKEDPFEVILGYSLLGYSFNGKMGMIERKDTPIMQLNNFTRSRSSLITHFAQSGVAGFTLLLSTLFVWSRYNKKRGQLNEIDLVVNALLKIFLPFTLFAAFIYDISITAPAVIGFAALIGVLKRYADLPMRVVVESQTTENLVANEV